MVGDGDGGGANGGGGGGESTGEGEGEGVKAPTPSGTLRPVTLRRRVHTEHTTPKDAGCAPEAVNSPSRLQLGLSHSHIGDSGDAQLGQCLLFEGPHAAGDVAGLVTVRVWISGACLAEGLRKDAEWWVPRYAIAFAGTSQPDEECIYGVPDPTSDLWSLANYAAAEEPSATTGMILTPTLTQPSKP